MSSLTDMSAIEENTFIIIILLPFLYVSTRYLFSATVIDHTLIRIRQMYVDMIAKTFRKNQR